MNLTVPGLGMGSLGLVLSPAREQWMMHRPVSSPQPRLCQAGRLASPCAWDELYLRQLPESVSGCVPMDIPLQGHSCGHSMWAWWPVVPRPCRASAWGRFASSAVVLRPSQMQHLPRAAACFSGDAFPLSLGFCNPRPPRAIYSPGFAVDLTSQPFPRAVPGQPDLPGCGRTKYFQHFLIRPKLVVFFAV